MRARFLRVLWLHALVVAACTVPLDLPRAPGTIPPVVESVTPSDAYAGDTVVLRGTALTGASGRATVRFGASKGVEVAAEADGSLRVTVPDDAGAGSVAVTTEGGTGTRAYGFLGLGRLRTGRLAESLDLRFWPTRAVPVGRAIAYLDTVRWYGLVLARGRWETHDFPGDVTVDVAGAQGAAHVLRRHPGPAEGECRWSVDTIRWPEGLGALPETSSTPVVWGWTGCDPFATELAVDDSGLRALLAHKLERLGILEGDGRFTEVQGLARPPSHVAACGQGFVVDLPGEESRTAVHTVVRDGSGWRASPWGEVELAGGARAIACRGDTVVLLGAEGEVVGLRGGVAFGRYASRDPRTTLGRIALSRDGMRAFVSLPETGRVVTVQLGPSSITPMTSVTLEMPTGIDVDTDGTVSVAVPGGSVRLSEATGAVVEALELQGFFGTPQLRRPPEGSPSALEVVVNSAVFSVTTSRPAGALTMEGRTRYPTEGSGPPLLEVVSTPATDALFALQGSSIIRLTGASMSEDGALFEVPPGLSAGSLALSSTGRDLLVPLHAQGARVAAELAVVGTSEGAALAVRLAAPSAQTWLVLADDRTIAWETPEGVILLDLEAARAGRSEGRVVQRPAGPAEPGEPGEEPGLRYLTGSMVDGRLTVVSTQDGDPAIEVIDVERGTWTVGDALPCAYYADDLVVSPSGRHAWFICRTSGWSGLLRGCDLEPETGRLGACTVALPLPGVPGELTVTPDGESVLFVDKARDALWRVE